MALRANISICTETYSAKLCSSLTQYTVILSLAGIENLATNVRTVDFQKVLNVVVNPHHETGNINGESLSGVCLPSSRGQNETGNTKGDILSGVSLPPSLGHDSQSSGSVRKGRENERIIEEVEEEVVELEFFDTTAVDKLHTHNAYCPKCSSRITKVVLRRVFGSCEEEAAIKPVA
ncbi:hypothetical protein FXO37_12429 [Capsicum annuum]|nr:hypothetical protein FXO37_12429 [Capsicum annuum]